MLRFLTSGESHGPALVAIVDGFPAGIPVRPDRINEELRLRQQGYGRGARQKIESDAADVLSGVRHGVSTGAPVALLVRNRDWQNWRYVMAVEPLDMADPEVAGQIEKKRIRKFRPGHADLAGTLKFRQKDIRDVLERASARETASRVAVGALCQQLLEQFGISLASHVIQVGPVRAAETPAELPAAEVERRARLSELFCLDEAATEKMKSLIKTAWQEGDSLGGVVEVLADGLPVGLGSYTQWDARLDGQLAQALMSVQAIKAVEIGDGVKAATLPGSQVHDAIYPAADATDVPGLPFRRSTNRAGGVEGGMSNGERLVVRAYMKPIPTLRKGLPSVTYPEFNADVAHYERSDVSAIAAASVVCKAVATFILARAFLEKFGGDSLTDIEVSLAAYAGQCRSLGPRSGSIGAPAVTGEADDDGAEPE